MKIVKYIIGYIAYAFFFLLIDPSGVGFKSHAAAISDWALGKSKKLSFASASINTGK